MIFTIEKTGYPDFRIDPIFGFEHPYYSVMKSVLPSHVKRYINAQILVRDCIFERPSVIGPTYYIFFKIL